MFYVLIYEYKRPKTIKINGFHTFFGRKEKDLFIKNAHRFISYVILCYTYVYCICNTKTLELYAVVCMAMGLLLFLTKKPYPVFVCQLSVRIGINYNIFECFCCISLWIFIHFSFFFFCSLVRPFHLYIYSFIHSFIAHGWWWYRWTSNMCPMRTTLIHFFSSSFLSSSIAVLA